MAESLKNRLLPSLLDRLTDEAPGRQEESFAQQVLSEEAFQETIRRDLRWLFNATSLESADNLDGFDSPGNPKMPNYLKQSVLNFGIQDFSGHTASSMKTADIQTRMRQAILHFEPRIMPDSLKIEVHASGQFNHNALSFDIRGDVWMQPSPLPQHWQTNVDLETGAVDIDQADKRR